ncbi:27473_t:CDS:2, partial [Racocetra persica]
MLTIFEEKEEEDIVNKDIQEKFLVLANLICKYLAIPLHQYLVNAYSQAQ